MAGLYYQPDRRLWRVSWPTGDGRRKRVNFKSEALALAYIQENGLELRRFAKSDDLVTANTHVDENGCWRWLGAMDRHGYGRVKRNGVITGAHRMAWIQTNGPIPEGLTVDHICFTTDCVNPEHLQLLTASQNASRQRQTLSNTCRRGHLFDEENTSWRPNGRRRCRACQRLNNAAAWARQKVVA